MRITDGYLENDSVYMVSEFFEHTPFHTYFRDCSMITIKNYMKNLLCALHEVHLHGVAHRDVKTENFLYNTSTNKSLLVDFGLAECVYDENNYFYIKNIKKYTLMKEDDLDLKDILNLQKNNFLKHRVGTRGFMPPEMSLVSDYQDTKVDIWSAGIILLSFFSKKIPALSLNKFSPFKDEIIRDIIPLIILFGRDRVIRLCKRFGCAVHLSDEIDTIYSENGFKELIKRDDVDEDALELLKGMLMLEPEFRFSAEYALKSPWFKEIE